MNRINLWLSAIPSDRFTLSGRCASSRRRWTRTASAFAAAVDVTFSRRSTGQMLAVAGSLNPIGTGMQRLLVPGCERMPRCRRASNTSTPSARGAGSAAVTPRWRTLALGRFLSIHVVWKLDPYLMRITRGRIGTGLGLLSTALLETKGARSGARRRNVVIYFHDGERVTIVASKLGLPEHPAWFHNLSADPDVVFAGAPMRASVVEEEVERERLWRLADRVFAPYADYRREAAKANRAIPIVQLTPR